MARVAIEARCDDDLLRMVFESAPGGMLITDLAGKITRVNRAFADMLGYTAAELAGMSIAGITAEGDATALVDELLSDGGEEVSSRRRYRTKSGAIVRTRERSGLRADALGEARFVLTQVDRVTEVKRDPLAPLSRREREVLTGVISGSTSKEIDAGLGMAPASVDPAPTTTSATDTTREVGDSTVARARVRRRVLLVDDDSAALQLLLAALKRKPYDILTASSACSALEILRTEAVDVVVADEARITRATDCVACGYERGLWV
jgi:PAS domain S-box-containing protein